MHTICLTRRRNQLELLHNACAARAPGILRRRRPRSTPGDPHNTRLLGMSSEYLWLTWPIDASESTIHADVGILVEFDQGGRRYRFPACVCERETYPNEYEGPVDALRVTLPLRVELADTEERRSFERIDLSGCPDLPLRLVHITNKHRTATARLTDISLGGFGATFEHDQSEAVGSDSLFWVELRLRPDDRPIDFVARLVHENEADGAVTTGWEFCATEDDGSYRRNLRQLQSFVAEQGHS